MKSSEVLRKARALIDRPEKWFGPLGTRDGGNKLCAGLALNEAITGDYRLPGYAHPSFAYFCKAINVDNFFCWLADWNNTEGRTHTEVMEAFDCAIALAEQEEQINAPLSESAHLSRTRDILGKIQADVHLVVGANSRST